MRFTQVTNCVPNNSGGTGRHAEQDDLRPALWASIDLLKTIRKEFKLSDRDFSVLNGLAALALKRDRRGHLVVFASNNTLSQKANGMNIRTLRRRISNLLDCGIIRRRSSPNGKRYAHHDADGTVIVAYGFDISPLLERMQEFQTRVAQEEYRRAMHKVARDQLSLLRLSFPIDSDEDIILRTALRRSSTTTAEMENLIEMFTAVNTVDDDKTNLDDLATQVILSATDGQNDLHLQSSIQSKIERIDEALPDRTQNDAPCEDPDLKLKMSRTQPTYQEVILACPEAISFAQDKPQNWNDLYIFSRWLAPMIGINHRVMNQAEISLGKTNLVMTLLAIVQMSGSIRSPSAYLRSLFQGKKAKTYSAPRLIKHLLRNQGSCAIS
jgi:replication initiation protein RepC